MKKKKSNKNKIALMRRRRLIRIAKYISVESPSMLSNSALMIILSEKFGVNVHGLSKIEVIDHIIEQYHKKYPEIENLALLPEKPKASTPSIDFKKKKEFYCSWEWRTLRMKALKKHGPACECCGARANMKTISGEPVRIVVDHIKPISKHWDLRLSESNLQVLCDECNMGKGAWDETDWRTITDSKVIG